MRGCRRCNAFGFSLNLICGSNCSITSNRRWVETSFSLRENGCWVYLFPKGMRTQLADMIRPFIDPYRVASLGYVDDLIDPAETRGTLIRGLELTRNKVVERPFRRREISPV